jgi:LEA14-like dessication related protein
MRWALPMKLVPTLLCLVLGCCALLPGCSTPPKLSGMTVTLMGIRPASSVAGDAHAIMTLRVSSENVNAIALSGSSHKFYLNGSYVGKAESDVPIGLPPLGSVTQDLRLNIENPAVVRQAVAAHDQPPASYRLESVLRVTDNEELLQVKSKFDGSISLRALEAVIR